MVKLQINKKFIPLKAHYFFFNGATGPVVPFMPTLGKQLGFSAASIGLIYTCLPVFGMFAKTGFGALADRYKIQKMIFLFFQLLTAVSFFCIMFIPDQPAVQTKFECGGSDSEFEFCSSHLDKKLVSNIISRFENRTLNCQLNCKIAEPKMWNTICEYWNSTQYCERTHMLPSSFKFTTISPFNLTVSLDSCVYFRVKQVKFPDDGGASSIYTPFCPFKDSKNISRHMSTLCDTVCDIHEVNELLNRKESDTELLNYKYWIFFILLALSWIGMAVIVSVGDTVCFEMLGDKPNLFGHQRLWGSIGWGLFALSAGFLVDYFSNGEMTKNYTIVFYIMLIMITLDFLTSFKLQYNQTKLSVSILHDVGKLLTEIRVVVFLLWCTCIGICTGLIWNFLFWYLEDLAETTNTSGSDLQSNSNHIKTLEGLLMGIQCFGGELPFFFLSSYILKKLGHINTMNLVLIGLGIRLILYSTLTSPWYALPIELLHGLSYGVFYATMASYASIVAPLGTETTIQGLVGAIFEIGVALGSLIAGKCMDTFGGAFTFRCYGIGCFIILGIHILVQRILKRSGRFVTTTVDDKDFDVMPVRYATPGDALHMIDDQQDIQLVEVNKNNNYHILSDVFS